MSKSCRKVVSKFLKVVWNVGRLKWVSQKLSELCKNATINTTFALPSLFRHIEARASNFWVDIRDSKNKIRRRLLVFTLIWCLRAERGSDYDCYLQNLMQAMITATFKKHSFTFGWIVELDGNLKFLLLLAEGGCLWQNDCHIGRQQPYMGLLARKTSSTTQKHENHASKHLDNHHASKLSCLLRQKLRWEDNSHCLKEQT